MYIVSKLKLHMIIKSWCALKEQNVLFEDFLLVISIFLVSSRLQFHARKSVKYRHQADSIIWCSSYLSAILMLCLTFYKEFVSEVKSHKDDKKPEATSIKEEVMLRIAFSLQTRKLICDTRIPFCLWSFVCNF